MKKILSLMFVLITVSTMFVSCDNDDKDAEKKSQVSFDGKSFDLTWGILENYGKDNATDEGYSFELTLLSSGISYNDAVGNFTGKGSLIYFSMYSQSATDLAEGSYEIIDPYGSSSTKPFTISYSHLNYDVNFDTESIGTIYLFVSGTVKVEKSDNVYEITIDAKDDNGNTFTGYYKGSLNYYDKTKK